MTDFPSEKFDRWKLHLPEDEVNGFEHPEDCGCGECDPDRARDEGFEFDERGEL